MPYTRRDPAEMTEFTTVPSTQLTEHLIVTPSYRESRWSVRKHVLLGGGIVGFLMAMMIIYLYAAGYSESDQDLPLGNGWRRFLEEFAKRMEGGLGEEAATGLSHTLSNIALVGAGVGAGCMGGYTVAGCRSDDAENYDDIVEGENRGLFKKQRELLSKLKNTSEKMQQGVENVENGYAAVCDESAALKPLVLELARHLLIVIMHYDPLKFLSESGVITALRERFPDEENFIETDKENNVPKILREACESFVILCYYQAVIFSRECNILLDDSSGDLDGFSDVMKKYIFGAEGELMRVVLRFHFINSCTFANNKNAHDFAAEWNALQDSFDALLQLRRGDGDIPVSHSAVMSATNAAAHMTQNQVTMGSDSEDDFSTTTGTGATPSSDGGRSGAGAGTLFGVGARRPSGISLALGRGTQHKPLPGIPPSRPGSRNLLTHGNFSNSSAGALQPGATDGRTNGR